MCNLYSVTKGQSAIRDLFAVKHDRAGNLAPLPAILPDQMAPIVRLGAEGGRELVMARWGMPAPPQHGGQLVTNIRNLMSPHWRGWLGRKSRCVVPATAFCEYEDTKPRKTPIWFALSQDRPLFAFAGLWTPWRGVRGPKNAPVEGEHELFGFLRPSQRPRRPDPSQGHAGHSDDARGGRPMARRRTRPRRWHCSGRCRMTRCGLWRRASGRTSPSP